MVMAADANIKFAEIGVMKVTGPDYYSIAQHLTNKHRGLLRTFERNADKEALEQFDRDNMSKKGPDSKPGSIHDL